MRLKSKELLQCQASSSSQNPGIAYCCVRGRSGG